MLKVLRLRYILSVATMQFVTVIVLLLLRKETNQVLIIGKSTRILFGNKHVVID